RGLQARVLLPLRVTPVREDLAELARRHVDVLERVDGAHEVGDLVPLRLVEVEAQRARPRVVELGPGVEGDDAFKRAHYVVVEEWRGLRRFHHRGRIEGAVPERAVAIVGSPEAAVLRKGLNAAGGMFYVFVVRIDVAVPTERVQGARIAMAARARATGVDWVTSAVDEERFAGFDIRVPERGLGQVEVAVPAQRQLERFHRVQLPRRGGPEIGAFAAGQAFGEIRRHRADRALAQRACP